MNIENFTFQEINEIDEKKKEKIKESMKKNGYVGTPIFYCNLGLLTGSHRIVAARELAEETEDEVKIKTVDLTEEFNEYCEINNSCYTDLDFAEIDEMDEKEIKKYLKGKLI